MSRARLFLLYATVVCVVAGSAIALRGRQARLAQSPLPTIDNPGAHGAKALFTYLEETGARPAALRESFEKLPSDARVLIALAPTRRLVTPKEWDSLKGWIAAGGTFVYAVPRRVRAQYLETALMLRWEPGPRPAPLLESSEISADLRKLLDQRSGPRDPTGADAVAWMPGGPMAGVRSLRVAADDGLETSEGRALALAGAGQTAFVLSLPLDRGEILLLAGSELAENRRIGLGDNLRLWANLASRGRVYFDEHHHTAPASEGPGLAAALGPMALQLLLVGLLLAFALGRRLGEPRPLTPARRRSQAEYLEQLSRLYARAGVDAQLCGELYRSLRLALHERLGISASLDDPEVGRRLQARTGVPAERYLALARSARDAERSGATVKDYLDLSREIGRFEREVGCG